MYLFLNRVRLLTVISLPNLFHIVSLHLRIRICFHENTGSICNVSLNAVCYCLIPLLYMKPEGKTLNLISRLIVGFLCSANSVTTAVLTDAIESTPCMMPSLFWGVTHRMLIVYRSFGTTYVSRICLILEYGTDRLSQNVGNYQPTLGKIPEERKTEVVLAVEVEIVPIGTSGSEDCGPRYRCTPTLVQPAWCMKRATVIHVLVYGR